MKKKIQELLGEEIILFELKAKGACNNAYFIETASGGKYIVKEERAIKDFKPQNTLLVEANIIQQLSPLDLSIPIPRISFVLQDPEMFGYEFMEGDILKDVWRDLSEQERITICRSLGFFHAEIGKVVTAEMVVRSGALINLSPKLHPEVEQDYILILDLSDIPPAWKTLAQQAKNIFDQTPDLGVFQFIHNDAHHENIIIQDKRIAGIIDFGESEYGEVSKEFSRYIRDYPDYAEYIIGAYEQASGHKLSRERLISNAFLSGLIDHVKDYQKGGEDQLRAEQAVSKYKELFGEL